MEHEMWLADICGGPKSLHEDLAAKANIRNYPPDTVGERHSITPWGKKDPTHGNDRDCRYK